MRAARRIPYVNQGIVMACTLAFVLGVPPESLAFVPAYFFGTVETAGPLPTWAVWRGLFGHVLIHSDIVHLVSNMLALWAFGGAVELAMGSLRYLLFFLLCAAAGAVVEGALAVDPMAPLVGASGAICGVMGAFLLLHPQATLGVTPGPRVPASFVVGSFLAINVAMTLMPPAPDSGLGDVAWAAHLGGFGAGMALVALFRRPGVALWSVARLSTAAKAAVYLTLVVVLLRTL
ncbi:rhomboid family intramembrane serine protease [Azospirillum baldaniorum]|uniref:Protein n=1 Tax=Azospirillum baldaniorum TaxID=1064539 RepID=A0A9P1JRR9_9PROT|nr:rhomboid family intramembrane serine protease [Azospirillum baldaniorum]AWJ90970.1 rhomboid family intramembrane serine protease [Azospirillum baldaniorum]NUB09214.1 rhomboid family intramembrane serine protease [Azospirillum baldaniorum]CCC98491.1 protein [Azospirillum baldaniorum]